MRFLLILVLLVSITPQTAFSQEGDSAALPVWNKYSVDAPAYFTNMSDRSMAFNPALGANCIAYGGDALYFSCYNTFNLQWQTYVIDSSTQVGEYAALRFDQYTRPFITYYDSLNAQLRMTYFDGVQWTYVIVPNVDGFNAPEAQELDAAEAVENPVPPQPAEAIDPQMLPVAAQADVSADMIPPPTQSFATVPSNDEPLVDESPAQPEETDKPGILERLREALDPLSAAVESLTPNFPINGAGYGKYSSIDFDRNNGIHITYHDEVDGSLEYLYWNGVVWNGKVVDDPSDQGDVGLWSSIDVDYNFNVHVAYMSEKYDDLKYAKRNATGGWNIVTVDGNAPGNGTEVGSFSSLALDTDFNPHISYYDVTNGRLKHAWKNNTGWHTEGVDGSGMVGWYTSIAVDDDDHVHVSYYNVSKGDLKYARKSGGWSISALDQTGKAANIGLFTSITLDANRRPAISYVNAATGELMYIHRNRQNTEWGGKQVVNSHSRDVGLSTSLAISNSGVPFVSYLDATSGSLKLARSHGATWSTQTLRSDPFSGMYSSIDLANGSSPRIAYYEQENRDLMYATNLGAGWWSFAPLDRYRDVGAYVSMELDSVNVPHISYYDASRNDLLYASWAPSASASGWYTQTVDFEDNVGLFTSIAVNTANQPFISYYHRYSGSLMMAYKSPATLSWVKVVVDNIGQLPQTGVGAYTSIDIDNQGRPHISYYDITNKMLKYAYWDGTWTGALNTGSWNVSVVDPNQDTGRFSSLAINPTDNMLHLCYYDYTNGNLMYAQGTLGVGWQRQVVDGNTADGDTFNEGDVGLYCSIDLNATGQPAISYYDNSHADLKVAVSYALPPEYIYLPLVITAP